MLLGFGNALAALILCISDTTGGTLLMVGLAVVPFVTTTVFAWYAKSEGSGPLRAGHFALLLAFGFAIELATVWGLLEMFFHSGSHWGTLDLARSATRVASLDYTNARPTG